MDIFRWTRIIYHFSHLFNTGIFQLTLGFFAEYGKIGFRSQIRARILELVCSDFKPKIFWTFWTFDISQKFSEINNTHYASNKTVSLPIWKSCLVTKKFLSLNTIVSAEASLILDRQFCDVNLLPLGDKKKCFRVGICTGRVARHASGNSEDNW